MVAGRPTSAYLFRIRVMWVLTVDDVMNRREPAACLLSVRTHALKTSISRLLSWGFCGGSDAMTKAGSVGASCAVYMVTRFVRGTASAVVQGDGAH